MKNLFLLLFLFPQLVLSQTFPVSHYPQNYFHNPLHIPILLAGGYGEIRPGHFHEGLDIKTQGRIGLPVYASASGYISGIHISNTGYGHAIYITHPNGYTTVYGHLHRFFPALEKYVKEKQYAQQSWAIALDFSPDLFPVKQGQFIAWSGATGSVAGPHVHFEIRDTKSEHPLNGMLFGLDIKDNNPPTAYRLAIYNMDKSIYEQTPEIFSLKKINGVFVPAKNLLLVNADKVGLGVQASDFMNSTSNSFGIYEEILYENNKPQIGFQLDNIGYDETRYVDAHHDYKTYEETGHHFQLLFSLPGNKLPVYYDFAGNGSINLSDEKTHSIKILVKDAKGNTSAIKFEIQKNPAYKIVKSIGCVNPMYADSRNIFENNDVQFFLKPGALYDSICFHFKKIVTTQTGYYSDIFQLGTSDIPMYDPFTLRIRPHTSIPEALRNKLVIVRQNTKGTGESVKPAKWDGPWLQATFRDFGKFSVQANDIPPVIIPLNIQEGADLSGATDIQFRISDHKSGIADYRGELDGKWLLFGQKGSIIYYTFDEHCPHGNHTLKLTVTDAVGNQSVRIYHFKR